MKIRRLLILFVIVFTFHIQSFAQTNSGENTSTVKDGTEAGAPSPAIPVAKEDEETPFSLYKDTYLLFGYSDSAFNKELVLKFQISAKFRMPLPGVYLAYTQRSFMDVLQNSAPFTDHNFEPEIYYIYSFSERFMKRNWLKSLQIGYRHESNGLQGDPSRSWERVFFESEFKHGGFSIQPTIWFPFYKDTGNSNVEDFWGYGELGIAYVWDNDVRIAGQFHMGTDWPKGNAKIDFSIPFNVFFTNPPKGWKQSSLWFQVFQGYGETFLGFNESSTAIATGIGFRPDFNK